MLWYYEKKADDPNSVIYAYGWNTKEKTGLLKYEKTTKKIDILKIADNDTQKGAEWAALHLLNVVKDGYPEKRTIMIG